MARLLLFAILPLTTGCGYFGDAGPAILCKTKLPATEYTFYLFGPCPAAGLAQHTYTLATHDGDTGFRELGEVSIDQPDKSKLDDLGNGVFRVTCGRPPATVFVTIDTKHALIVEDSNKSNPKNSPLETPRYLRPEVLRLNEKASREPIRPD